MFQKKTKKNPSANQTRVCSLPQEGSACRGATQLRCHNNQAYTLEPKSHEHRSLSALQPALHESSRCNEKAVQLERSPALHSSEKPAQPRRPSTTKNKERKLKEICLKNQYLFPTFRARNPQWAQRGGSLPP